MSETKLNELKTFKFKSDYVLVTGLNKNGMKYLALADVYTKKIATFNRDIIEFVTQTSIKFCWNYAVNYDVFKKEI